MKTFFSSLLIVFVTIFVAPAFADDACKNLFNPNALPTFTGDLGYIVGGQPEPISDGFKVTLKTATDTRYNYYVFLPAEEGYVYSCEAPSVGKFAKFDKDRWAFVYSKLGNGGLPVGTVIEFHKVQLERGSTATAYQPYNPLCATCQGIVKNYESAVGTVAQNGTPSPANPIEPVFYQQGDMILRKIDDTYYDSYDATTGKITRRVGVKVFTGEESGLGSGGVYMPSDSYYIGLHNTLFPGIKMETPKVYSTHWQQGAYTATWGAYCSASGSVYFAWNKSSTPDLTTQQRVINWLAQQYANGTPVTVYYPLATPVEETVTQTTYCAAAIKIATTAYNTARFSPVVNDLNSTVATIREIVTKTINQTAAIASLQADKQTRPDEQCPAGKKCLLVETEENGVIVPHWFPIIEAPEDN